MQTTAETYANHAALSLAIADESLKRLQETLKHEGETAFGRVARIMSDQETVGGAINRVALVDKKRTDKPLLSQRCASSFGECQRSRLFQAFRDDPRDRILITEPILGRASGQWIILFVRPILSAGKFAGVIIVGLDANQLSKLVTPPKKEGLLITLLSPGGRIIARSEGDTDLLGRQLEMPTEAFRSDAFDLKSPVDGISRRFAVRTTPDWGMHIIAGMDQRVIDAEVDEHTRIAMLPALLLTLLLAPAVLLIRRALQQQQAAENERDKAARRSRTVLESMSEGVLLVDAEGIIVFANDAAAQWLPDRDGKRFPEALAAAGMSLVTEDGNPYAIADPLSFVCLESGLEIDDAWLMDSDPQKRLQWLAMRARPLLADDGKISGAAITIVDRTDEHERIADAEMSRTILARMNDAVMVTDARANVLMVNSAYTRLSGYSEAELIGNTANVGRSDRQDSAFWAAMWQALTQQKKWSGKVWNLKKGGSEYCVWHTITAVHDLRGRVVRYVAVSRDITDQQEKEADLWRRATLTRSLASPTEPVLMTGWHNC
ncbi:MAG: PAS domain S-box protein [Betaproteobacteria bacterium]|uniref:PAS domain S-box protein n=1 Tax=Candidatus Proximibacter danicus TaxID=2954365 RepID=A0A9D7K1W1_9PROT|nr:PAS domain S-box protein [Candidatus Proximibacter danicus]